MSEFFDGLKSFLSSWGEPTQTIDEERGLHAVRDGYKVQEVPRRSRRLHTFTDLAGFADWLKRHAIGEEKTVEIGVRFGEEGYPVVDARPAPTEPGSDAILCEVPLHPTFAAWSGALGAKMTQKVFHTLVRAHRDSLGDGALELLTALSSMRTITGGEMKIDIDGRGTTRFAGMNSQQEVVGKIPADILVTTPLFAGVLDPDIDESEGVEASYELEMLVDLQIESGTPFFSLWWPRRDLVVYKAMRDLSAYLSSLLGEPFLVGMATMKTETVRSLRA